MTPSPLALLSPERVLLDLRADDETAAIRTVAGLLAHDPQVVDAARLADEVIERERLSSTSMGSGVAFPHARTALVKDIVTAVGRSTAGVPFGSKREPVHFVFIIGTPPDRAPQYLAFVGTLARLLRAESTRQKLLAAATPAAFVAALHTAA